MYEIVVLDGNLLDVWHHTKFCECGRLVAFVCRQQRITGCPYLFCVWCYWKSPCSLKNEYASSSWRSTKCIDSNIKYIIWGIRKKAWLSLKVVAIFLFQKWFVWLDFYHGSMIWYTDHLMMMICWLGVFAQAASKVVFCCIPVSAAVATAHCLDGIYAFWYVIRRSVILYETINACAHSQAILWTWQHIIYTFPYKTGCEYRRK